MKTLMLLDGWHIADSPVRRRPLYGGLMSLRRHTLPDAVRSAVPVPRGDRILAFAELTDSSWIVAERGSLLVVAAQTVRVERPWCDVHSASFDPQTATITVTWVDDAEPLVATLSDIKHLALVRTVRERVERSVILAETVTVAGGRTVRVAVRRDASERLFSQVVADAGVDLTDPDTADTVDGAESRVRSAAGLPL
jgi:hypothetical protein